MPRIFRKPQCHCIRCLPMYCATGEKCDKEKSYAWKTASVYKKKTCLIEMNVSLKDVKFINIRIFKRICLLRSYDRCSYLWINCAFDEFLHLAIRCSLAMCSFLCFYLGICRAHCNLIQIEIWTHRKSTNHLIFNSNRQTYLKKKTISQKKNIQTLFCRLLIVKFIWLCLYLTFNC